MSAPTQISSGMSREFLEKNKHVLVVLVFDASFTEQANVVREAVEALSASDVADKIVVSTVDVEQNNDLATRFNVVSVPMIVCVKNNQAVKRIDTLEANKLIAIIKEQVTKCELFAGQEAGESNTGDCKDRLNKYLKQLVNRANIMIFMKGEPSAPRCGFSKQLVELLSRNGIQNYSTFDILQDEEVRQGLKEYSDWPTYPQVYVKGEFVGGLDILKQMEESGELASTFKI